MSADAPVPTLAWRGEAWYWRLRKRLSPGLRNAQYTYFETLDAAVRPGDRWLDIGCGRQIVPPWMKNNDAWQRRMIERAGEVVGIDPDAEALAENTLPIIKHRGPAECVPEPDGCFDLISANMVAEHLESPQRVLEEVARLLKPGGRFILHTPNVFYPLTLAAAMVPSLLRDRVTAWLEKRPLQTIYPTYYRFNSPRCIRKLAAGHELKVVDLTLTPDSPETIGLGPFVGIELLLIAATRTRLGQPLRSNLIVTLQKPAESEDPSVRSERRNTHG
jgi:ubiquinone/menaquinone biosynthesis C-methylase UbiE